MQRSQVAYNRIQLAFAQAESRHQAADLNLLWIGNPIAQIFPSGSFSMIPEASVARLIKWVRSGA